MIQKVDSHKKHKNILYALVFLLLVFQISSFVFISIRVSKLETKLTSDIQTLNEDLTSKFTASLEEYNKINQQNTNELSIALSQQATQQQSFEKEIDLLKVGQEDLSSIITVAVNGVVAVMTENSMGSGFIVSSDGYVVTNYHVIQNGERIRILHKDNKIIDAEVMAIDRLRDLALLKMEGEYNYLELANSDELQVGRKVIAIGNPLGLSFTVTEGIISGLKREGPNGIQEYIQTDVSLNPGNSGGPLLDTKGRVIGINNFKIGGAEGLGFSLESNSIRTSINSLLGEEIIE